MPALMIIYTVAILLSPLLSVGWFLLLLYMGHRMGEKLNMRKVIIAGGRDLYLTIEGYALLNELNAKYKFSEVVNGMARGIDECARNWAKINKIPVKKEYPQWKKYGRAAGPIRNKKMAQHAGETGVCILFKGGDGTQSMFDEANKCKLLIIDLRSKENLVAQKIFTPYTATA